MMKFRSRPVAEHVEVPLADEGHLEDVALAEESASYVASVGTSRDPLARAAQLAEITSLVSGRIVGSEILHLGAPNPRTLLGTGAAEELGARARAAGATMLVVDAELSPSQTRNLEDVAKLPICDREAVILDVFTRHARTKRARIQVEVAKLEFLRPRIRGVGLDMDQQSGASRYARGPGETASELLARKIDTRLAELRKALRKIEVSGETQRRDRAECERLALVGYTNAGKTSLMNALTSAGLSARDMPFETLDTTSRALTRHGGDVVVSDTVGFIRRLPERLLASFESTLAEIHEATLLVVVVDASDHERELHLSTTLDLIEKIGAGHIPRFHVWNKVDRLASFEPPNALEPWAAVSAHDPASVRALEERLLGALGRSELTTFVPYAAKDVLSLVYARCRILESHAAPRGVHLKLQGPPVTLRHVREAAKQARKELTP